MPVVTDADVPSLLMQLATHTPINRMRVLQHLVDGGLLTLPAPDSNNPATREDTASKNNDNNKKTNKKKTSRTNPPTLAAPDVERSGMQALQPGPSRDSATPQAAASPSDTDLTWELCCTVQALKAKTDQAKVAWATDVEALQSREHQLVKLRAELAASRATIEAMRMLLRG